MKTKLILALLTMVVMATIGSANSIIPNDREIHASVSVSEDSLSRAYAAADVITKHNDQFTYIGGDATDHYSYAFSASTGGDSMNLKAGASITDTGKVVAFGQAYADGAASSVGMISTAKSGENGNTASIDTSASAIGINVKGFTYAIAYG